MDSIYRSDELVLFEGAGIDFSPGKQLDDAYAMLIVQEGQGSCLIRSQAYPLDKGTFILARGSDLIQELQHKTKPRCLHCLFTRSFLHAYDPILRDAVLELFASGQPVRRLASSASDEADRLIAGLNCEARDQQSGFTAFLQNHLLQLLLWLKRSGLPLAPASTPPGDQGQQRISLIAAHVQEHFRESVSLEELASQYSVTPSYLSRIFRENTGYTLTEYVNRLRVQEARRLLKQSDASVADIARLVGFEHDRSFGRVFKRMTGLTPGQCRKKE